MTEIKTLYKYRDWSDKYHKRMVTKRHVWLSSAADFNDPYDCALNLSVIQSLVANNQLDEQIKNLYGAVNDGMVLKLVDIF